MARKPSVQVTDTQVAENPPTENRTRMMHKPTVAGVSATPVAETTASEREQTTREESKELEETTRKPERSEIGEQVSELKSKLDHLVNSDHPVSRPLLWRLLAKRVADIRKMKGLNRLIDEVFSDK